MSRHLMLLMCLISAVLFGASCQKEAAQSAPPQPPPAAKEESKKDLNLITLSPDAIKYANLQFAEVTEEQISAPLEVDGEALLLAPSIGIARSPDDATEVQELIRCAMHSANLAAGDPASAARLMGRPFEISGHVRHGEQIGRKLGFPTANVDHRGFLQPATGVYAIRAMVQGDEPRWIDAD